MNDETQTAKAIFGSALEIDSPKERSTYLDRACGENPPLRGEVEALLKSLNDAGSFLEKPPVEIDLPDIDPALSEELDLSSFLDPCDKPDCLGQLGPYEITEVIGSGGMGVVLKGRDAKLNRVLAIKVLAPQFATNASGRKRFLREGRAAAAISHDHVVTIHGIDETGQLPYLMMEYIDGLSLQQRIDRDGPLELKEILRIGKQTALGLAAAHAEGLIHRDIKPANILLENGVERVKITDFGLARAVDDVSITQPGVVTGTPQYMSPEQAQNESLDHRSDLFSLGSVLYAMCTSRPPFRGDTTVAVIRRVCDATLRPICEVNPNIPDFLVAIIDRLLAKNPDDRFQTASEVADLLGKYLAHEQDPALASMPVLEPNIEKETDSLSHSVADSKSPRRRRWVIAAAVVLLLVGGLGITEATRVTRIASTLVEIWSPPGTLIVDIADPDVTVTQAQAIPITDGLVGYWPGDGTADDLSGNDNHGTLENGATFGAGIVGQAFSLDGIDDYVEIPFGNGSLGFSGNGTVGAWVNLKSLEPLQRMIFINTVEPGPWGIQLALVPINIPRTAVVIDDVGIPQASDNPIGTDEWHHLAGVREGTKLKFYIDGKLDSERDIPSGPLRTGSGVSRIGKAQDIHPIDKEYHGLIDEVFVYDRALSDFEIQQLANISGQPLSVTLAPSAINIVKDDDSDGISDDMGDVAVNVSANTRSQVGEVDSSTKNEMNRLVAKFALPDAPVATPLLESATLRFFLETIVGTPAGPLSLAHSITDNDLDLLASDYENPNYIGTALDLIQPTDPGGQYYELDVTEQVLADYAADGLNPQSAFRFEVSEAIFLEDNQSSCYRLKMPGSVSTPPQLILTFATVPELSNLRPGLPCLARSGRLPMATAQSVGIKTQTGEPDGCYAGEKVFVMK